MGEVADEIHQVDAEAAAIDAAEDTGRTKEQEEKIAALRKALDSDDGRQAAAQLVQGGEIANPEQMLEHMFLRRWLRARSWDVDVAARCIISHAAWRAGIMPNGPITPAQIPNELGSEKAFMLGSDKQGRAVLLIQAKKHKAWTRKLEELELYVCYLLDAAVNACDLSLNPRGHIAVILDLTDMGATNMDVQAVQALFKLLGAHYVERLGQMIIYNPPMIFWGAWNTLSPLLPPVTLKKIMVVALKDKYDMVDSVGPEVMPAEYGGCGKDLVPMC